MYNAGHLVNSRSDCDGPKDTVIVKQKNKTKVTKN